MEDFIKSLGPAFMPHLLRRLYDDFARNIEAWYEEIGIRAPLRTHSTMAALGRFGALGVTELGALLRQSHPLVLTWVRQLKELGFVMTKDDPEDGRRTLLHLTRSGKLELKRHKEADRLVAQAIRELMQEVDAEVFEPLWRLEGVCRREPFVERLRRTKS